MKRTYVLHQLSMLKGKLSDNGVSSIGLFASTVRNENRPDSDIDILVDFTDGNKTYDNFMSVCDSERRRKGKGLRDGVLLA